jgi:hypothetical protein
MKVFFFLFLVVAMWVGLTIYTEGSQQAFGGLFAGAGGPQDAPASRLEDRMVEKHDRHQDRLQDAIERSEGETGDDW